MPWRLRLRDFRSPGFGSTLDDLLKLGFVILAEESPRELALGLAGRFWTLYLDLQTLTPEGFLAFAKPGFAKVGANFLVEPLGPGLCRLSTATRIFCLGREARRGFRRYWLMIRPFSGLIRREWLRLIRRGAELGGGPGQAWRPRRCGGKRMGPETADFFRRALFKRRSTSYGPRPAESGISWAWGRGDGPASAGSLGIAAKKQRKKLPAPLAKPAGWPYCFFSLLALYRAEC